MAVHETQAGSLGWMSERCAGRGEFALVWGRVKNTRDNAVVEGIDGKRGILTHEPMATTVGIGGSVVYGVLDSRLQSLVVTTPARRLVLARSLTYQGGEAGVAYAGEHTVALGGRRGSRAR
jgi:hypothetical protein